MKTTEVRCWLITPGCECPMNAVNDDQRDGLSNHALACVGLVMRDG